MKWIVQSKNHKSWDSLAKLCRTSVHQRKHQSLPGSHSGNWILTNLKLGSFYFSVSLIIYLLVTFDLWSFILYPYALYFRERDEAFRFRVCPSTVEVSLYFSQFWPFALYLLFSSINQKFSWMQNVEFQNFELLLVITMLNTKSTTRVCIKLTFSK